MICDILKEVPHRHPDLVAESVYIDQPGCYPAYEILGKILSPERFLEMGTLLGGSVIAIMHGSQNVKEVTFIDIEEYIAGSNRLAKENIEYYVSKYYKSSVDCHSYKSIKEFKSVAQNIQAFDLVHVDGDHTYDGTMIDLEFALSLNPKHIIVDDITFIPPVFDAVRDFIKKHYLCWFGIKTFRGMAYVNNIWRNCRSMKELVKANGLYCFDEI